MNKNFRLPFSACNLFTPHLFLNRVSSRLCKLLQAGLPLLIFVTSCFSIAQAQPYPNRPIKLIIPFPPGGPTDLFGRQYAQSMSIALNNPVVAENKGGAAGAIGSAEVKRSKPDGYTLLFGTISTHGLYNLLNSKPQYDAVKDFSHIAMIGEAPVGFAVHPSMPNTLKEFVQLVRSNPTKYQYGSAGEGTFLHIAGEQLKLANGNLPIQHIPYRGSGQSLPALMAGEVSMTADTLSVLIHQHRAGKIRILGLGSSKHFLIASDIPTVNEALGLKNFETMAWYVIMAPIGLPSNIMTELTTASNKALSDPVMIEKLNSLSIQPTVDMTDTKATDFIKHEINKLTPLIQALSIKLAE